MQHHIYGTIAKVNQAICGQDHITTVTKQGNNFMLHSEAEGGCAIIVVTKGDNGWLVKAGLDEWLPLNSNVIVSYIEGISE